jgi:hypothetical protein
MGRIIVFGIFLLAIIFFLMPWISVSCAVTEIFSASGLDMVRGSYNIPSEFSGGTSTENEPIAIYALVAAGVGLIVSIFRGGIWRFLRVLAGVAGIAFMVWLKFKLDDNMRGAEASMLQLNYLLGYWLTLGAFALATVVSLFIKDSPPKYITPTPRPTQVAPPPGGVPPPSPPLIPPPPPNA